MRSYFFFMVTMVAFFPLLSAETENFSIIGTLKPSRAMKIYSQVEGFVQKVPVKVGSSVKKGDLLLQVDPSFLEIEWKTKNALFKEAEIAYEEAKVEFQRMSHLWEKKEGESPSISKKQWEEAKFRLKKNENLLERAKLGELYAKKRLQEATIVAPYIGVISKKGIEENEYITQMPQPMLFELIDTSELLLDFSLPQQLRKKVHVGSLLFFHPDQETKEWQAVVEEICPQVEESTRTLFCRARVKNPEGKLQPGIFVRGSLVLSSSASSSQDKEKK